MVVPWHITIFAYFLVIEHCPEEIGDAVVFLADLFIGAVYGALEVVVQ